MEMLLIGLQVALLLVGILLWGWLKGLPDSLHRRQEQVLQQELTKELEKLRASFARDLELLKISHSQLQAQKTQHFIQFGNLQRKMLTDKRFLDKVKAGDPKVMNELRSDVLDLGTGLFFFASDEAVRDYASWKTSSARGELEGVELLRALGKLMVVLRRDLGYTDTLLTEDDFLSLFITDWHKYRQQGEAARDSSSA